MPANASAGGRKRRGSGVPVFRAGSAVANPAVPARAADEDASRALMLPAIFVHTAQVWDALEEVALTQAALDANNLFLQANPHPAAAAFDILRSRLLHEVAEKQWHRIAITSPGPGCGKSFVAANLALSLARRPGSRTALVDLDPVSYTHLDVYKRQPFTPSTINPFLSKSAIICLTESPISWKSSAFNNPIQVKMESRSINLSRSF